MNYKDIQIITQALKNNECSKKKSHFAYKIIYLCIIEITLYTILAFLLQFLGKFEISSTLTTCFFAFFGGELLVTALIKIFKVRVDKKEEQPALADDENEGKGDIYADK